MDPIYGYQAINVEAQLSDPVEPTALTATLIALRKLFQVFRPWNLSFLNPANRKNSSAYLRRTSSAAMARHETVLLRGQPPAVLLSPSPSTSPTTAAPSPVEMLGYVPFPTITEAS